MISFRQLSPALIEACRLYDLSFVIDSGAFAGELSRQQIEKYAGVIIENQDALWFANADVIGNQEQSEQNYHFLLSLLPPHLHNKVLYVYQMSAALDSLYCALEGRSAVGVGGIVPLFHRDAQAAEMALMHVARIIADHGGIAPHYFGIGRRDILQKLNAIHQGIFSADSTTWLVGSKFNRIIRKDGVQVDASGMLFSKEEMLCQNIRVMLSWLRDSSLSQLSPVAMQKSLF